MSPGNAEDRSNVHPHPYAGDQLTYAEYLGLDSLLAAQRPLSQEHDELAFIIIHHVQELWLKLLAHELESAMGHIRKDELPQAFKIFDRITQIQNQLIAAWNVLSTITPAEYLTFRSKLGHASGFQSFQYRLVEFRLGVKDKRMLLPHCYSSDIQARIMAALTEPSLYDEVLRLLARRGYPLPGCTIERDFSQPYVPNPVVLETWLKIYRELKTQIELYTLAESLIEIEDPFQQWRFRHMRVVERIIGYKPGTGGSAGVGFLRAALDRSFFPELWEMRTLL